MASTAPCANACPHCSDKADDLVDDACRQSQGAGSVAGAAGGLAHRAGFRTVCWIELPPSTGPPIRPSMPRAEISLGRLVA